MAKPKDPRIGQKFYFRRVQHHKPPFWDGPYIMKGVWKSHGTEFCKLVPARRDPELYIYDCVETKHLKPASEVELLKAITEGV